MDQNLYNRLYPHQVEGVKFMWNNIHCKGVNGGMLSDDMGLGKTIQGKISILFILKRDTSSQCLFGPNSVRGL